MIRSLAKSLVVSAILVSAASATVSRAAAVDQCAAVKTKVECGKKAGCAWNGKVCAAKTAKVGAKGAKAGKKPAEKKAEAKPTPSPTPAGGDMPFENEVPAGDGEAEDF